MNNSIFTILLAIFIPLIVFPQESTINGKIVDNNMLAIDFAAVLYKEKGNLSSQVVLSDSLGNFSFKSKQIIGSSVIVQHLLYQTDTFMIEDSHILDNLIITLREKDNLLQEVEIKGEFPQVIAKENNLVYNAQAIMNRRIITNAYDLVKGVPLVIEKGGELSLLGSEQVDIIINDQRSSMTLEQVSNLLKNMPADNIKEIQVTYSPSNIYNVKGALINLILKDTPNNNSITSGELSAGYEQKHDPTSFQKGNISYSKNKFRLDALGAVYSGKSWNKSEFTGQQTINNITSGTYGDKLITGDYINVSGRIGANYTFNNKSNLSLAYYTNWGKINNTNEANNTYIDNNTRTNYSTNTRKDKKQLHYVNTEYRINKIRIGGDYTFFYNPTKSYYVQSDLTDEQWNNSNQRVNKWSAYFNNESKLSENLRLTYGLNGAMNDSKTFVEYLYTTASNNLTDNAIQKEYTANVFGEIWYKIRENILLSATLKTEYFKSSYSQNEESNLTLWNDIDLFPIIRASWSINSKNNIQFSLNTGKRYPSFWAVNPQVTILDSYNQIEGNPYLKPNKSYTGRLTYTKDKKYSLVVSTSYSPVFFQQTTHFSEVDEKYIHRFENYDYRWLTNISLSVPFSICEIFNTNVSLSGQRVHEKLDPFYDTSFNNIQYGGSVGLYNSVKITDNVLIELDGRYNSPMEQGTYTLGESWCLDLCFSWSVAKHGKIVLNYDNILKKEMFNPTIIDYGMQHRRDKTYDYSRIGVSFSWSFNNYKTPRYKYADSNRLGK